MYRTESALVAQFLLQLDEPTSPWGEVRHGREFDFQRGRTDVIAVDSGGGVIAFEAKLKRWRTALNQAYRNLCFAHRSYVVLPAKVAQLAAKHAEEFSLRGVGLCSMDTGTVTILWESAEADPIQPWLSDRATLHVEAAR